MHEMLSARSEPSRLEARNKKLAEENLALKRINLRLDAKARELRDRCDGIRTKAKSEWQRKYYELLEDHNKLHCENKSLRSIIDQQNSYMNVIKPYFYGACITSLACAGIWLYNLYKK